MTGDGLIVIVVIDIAGIQGPAPSGSSVVKVKVTEPIIISSIDGVYTAFSVTLSGLKEPVPPVHVPVVAFAIDPLSVMDGASSQTGL